MEQKNAWEKYPEGDKRQKVMDFAESYRQFLSTCKTERECTSFFIEEAKKDGFTDLKDIIEKGGSLKAGDKVYLSNMGKAIALFVIGSEPLEKGMSILGAHIDSPRMDLKQVPLYEDTGMALLDTHYYGGIKKYQWVTLPLALHGVIAKADGTVVNVNVGEDPSDP
ncbi:MAG: aminopeptidase, partial [Lachnospiraceae bacterium]|nr:aminopeptidase [Lachnospiraceae bacterium]